MAESDNEIWEKNHRRFFRIGGITIQVDSDLPFNESTFNHKFASFQVDGPGPDTVRIHHHFSLPKTDVKERGKEYYRKPPWAIYRKEHSWVYTAIPLNDTESVVYQYAIFSEDHAVGEIYNRQNQIFLHGNLGALTMFPTDQILIARLLADRQGCFLHSCGAVMNGKGLLFVGHSEAKKTTTARMIMPYAEILCDDRNIVRHHEDGWKVYGTWSHGDLPDVSSRSAPLHAILFLEQANENRITPIKDRREIAHRLLATVIRPFVTVDWWEKTLRLVEAMTHEVPCYRMEFNKSGDIVGALKNL